VFVEAFNVLPDTLFLSLLMVWRPFGSREGAFSVSGMETGIMFTVALVVDSLDQGSPT
jgi:hypothetical protein